MADPTKQVDFLNLSDEEMRNMPPPDATTSVTTEADATNAGQGTDEAAQPNTDAAAAGSDANRSTDETGEEDGVDQADQGAAAGAAGDQDGQEKGSDPDLKAKDGDDETGDKPGEKSTDDKSKTTDTKKPEGKEAKAEGEGEKAEKTDKAEKPAVDYEAEYKKLLAPFKANGREIQVESVEDAVALMQMGANYNKKMAALKPNLKLMKMLENNGFLSEDKIGFLIDLGKKNPAAISKLVKESGIDPMDLDAEKASAYKQTAYAVDDREIDLDTVLEELQGSETYTRTLDMVSNKWDAASKQTVSKNPELLKVLDNHMASGIADLINTEIERQRMLGRLKGLSDIEAYRQVGDTINARGGFNHLVQPKSEPESKPAPKTVEVVTPKPKAAEDDKLKDKRRAAGSTKAAAPTTTPADFNPLAMSDEEFSKVADKRYR